MLIVDASNDNLTLGGNLSAGTFLNIFAGEQSRGHITAQGYAIHLADDVYTDSGDSALANHHAIFIGRPTIASTATTGTTSAATLYIENAPLASGGTITNPYTLHVDAGDVRLDGDLLLNGTPELFINETANANNTVGLTINQGAADDNLIDLKSSDVVHGMTDAQDLGTTETDSFGTLLKSDDDAGGLLVVGTRDGDGNPSGALILHGRLGEAASTATTTASKGVVEVVALVASGSGFADVADDGNVMEIRKGTGITDTVWLIEGNGDVHGVDTDGVEGLDNHNDAALTVSLESYRLDSQKVVDFATMRATSNFDELVEIGLLGKITAEQWNAGVRPLFNKTREQHLHRGNARQAQGRMDALLDVLEADPQFRGRMRAAMQSRGLGHLARP